MQRSVEQRLAQANRREWGGHLANLVQNIGFAGFWIPTYNNILNSPESYHNYLNIIVPAVIGTIGLASYFVRERLNKQADSLRTNLPNANDLHTRMEKRQQVVGFLAFAPVAAAAAITLSHLFFPADTATLVEGFGGGLAVMYSLGSAIKSGAEARAITRRLR